MKARLAKVRDGFCLQYKKAQPVSPHVTSTTAYSSDVDNCSVCEPREQGASHTHSSLKSLLLRPSSIAERSDSSSIDVCLDRLDGLELRQHFPHLQIQSEDQEDRMFVLSASEVTTMQNVGIVEEERGREKRNAGVAKLAEVSTSHATVQTLLEEKESEVIDLSGKLEHLTTCMQDTAIVVTGMERVHVEVQDLTHSLDELLKHSGRLQIQLEDKDDRIFALPASEAAMKQNVGKLEEQLALLREKRNASVAELAEVRASHATVQTHLEVMEADGIDSFASRLIISPVVTTSYSPTSVENFDLFSHNESLEFNAKSVNKQSSHADDDLKVSLADDVFISDHLELVPAFPSGCADVEKNATVPAVACASSSNTQSLEAHWTGTSSGFVDCDPVEEYKLVYEKFLMARLSVLADEVKAASSLQAEARESWLDLMQVAETGVSGAFEEQQALQVRVYTLEEEVSTVMQKLEESEAHVKDLSFKLATQCIEKSILEKALGDRESSWRFVTDDTEAFLVCLSQKICSLEGAVGKRCAASTERAYEELWAQNNHLSEELTQGFERLQMRSSDVHNPSVRCPDGPLVSPSTETSRTSPSGQVSTELSPPSPRFLPWLLSTILLFLVFVVCLFFQK